MKSLLEEMYYANFNLKCSDEERMKRMREASGLIERNENDLKELLSDKGKEILEKYIDCTNEMQSLSNLSQFIAGFRLGGRMVMEIFFGAENMELQD